MKKGWNEDRHACKECIYRGSKYRSKANTKDGIDNHGCSYILLMNQSRGCDAESCTRFVRDKKIVRRKKK